MVQLGFRKPNNKVSQGGALGVEYFKVGAAATAAKMLPCIAVIKDTNDFSVKEGAAAGKIIGFLGYDETPAQYRPTNSTTAYAVGDIVAVHRGPGRRQKAILTSGQNVVNGEPLKVGADGKLVTATLNGAASIELTGNAQTITVGNDDVIGDADESVNASGADAYIWIITRK